MSSSKEIERLRAMLFPYADATEISGLSTDGCYWIGDKKSIERLHYHMHRSLQIDIFSSCYEQKLTALQSAYSELERYADHLSAQLLEYQLKEQDATDCSEQRVAALGPGDKRLSGRCVEDPLRSHSQSQDWYD
ncbi:hypothetical protein ACXHXM_34105